MWSFFQYRQLRKQVERDWRARSSAHQRHISRPLQAQCKQSLNPHIESDGSSTQIGPTPDLEEEKAESRHEPAADGLVLVECASEDDQLNPRNWPVVQRIKVMVILCLLVFVQAWAAENLSTAMYLFGIGSGCFFTGPLSQTFGRNPVYLWFTFAYLFFVLGSALSTNFTSQIICRYFVGLSSSGTLGINGASLNDLFSPVELALWFPIIAWVNVAPPVIAPIVGGWISSRQDLDFRWTEFITLYISLAAFVLALVFLPETYLPVLLDWKAKHLREVTGDDRYRSEHAEQSSLTARIKQILPMSVKFTTTEPAIIALGSYLVLLYVLLFSFLSGFDYIFKRTYNLSPLLEGACFGAIGAGATTFTCLAPGMYAWSRHHTKSVRGPQVVPEFRLWPAMITAPLLPLSLFWLGWTNDASISIWSGLAACFCFGIVLNAMYVSSYEYIIDSYGANAAIALASITMMRYLIAGCMVMAARPMYDAIGVHWSMTILGCVAFLLLPCPYLLYSYGDKLRERSPYADTDIVELDSS